MNCFSCREESRPSTTMVFQCFLFMWYPGSMHENCSRNSTAIPGSHFTLNCRGSADNEASRNILLLVLNTRVSSPKGKPSQTSFSDNAYSRISSIFIKLKERPCFNSSAKRNYLLPFSGKSTPVRTFFVDSNNLAAS